MSEQAPVGVMVDDEPQDLAGAPESRCEMAARWIANCFDRDAGGTLDEHLELAFVSGYDWAETKFDGQNEVMAALMRELLTVVETVQAESQDEELRLWMLKAKTSKALLILLGAV